MNRAIQWTWIMVSVLISPIVSSLHAGAQTGFSSAQHRVFEAQPAMHRVTLTGYTRARHVMDVVSEVAGRCVRVAADVGDTLGEEGIFCLLDTTFIDLTIEKNRVDQGRTAVKNGFQGRTKAGNVYSLINTARSIEGRSSWR